MEAYSEHLGWVCLRFKSIPESARTSPSTPFASQHKGDNMSNAGNHHKISYIEFTTRTLSRQAVLLDIFGWSFVDWGPTTPASGAGLMEGSRNAMRSRSWGSLGRWWCSIRLTGGYGDCSEDGGRRGGGADVRVSGGRRFTFRWRGNVLGVWSSDDRVRDQLSGVSFRRSQEARPANPKEPQVLRLASLAQDEASYMDNRHVISRVFFRKARERSRACLERRG